MKNYTIYYIIKMNGTQYSYKTDTTANTAKEAKAKVVLDVEQKTGRHAFAPSTTPPKNLNVEVLEGFPPHK